MSGNEAFALGLALASLVAWASGRSGLQRTAMVMIGNLGICWGVIAITGDYGAWYLFGALNFISGVVVLQHPAARTQAIIGCIYVAQIIVDVGYFLVGSMQAIPAYQLIQTMAGWCQIAALVAGGIYGTGLRLGYNWPLRGCNSVAAKPHLARVEAKK